MFHLENLNLRCCLTCKWKWSPVQNFRLEMIVFIPRKRDAITILREVALDTLGKRKGIDWEERGENSELVTECWTKRGPGKQRKKVFLEESVSYQRRCQILVMESLTDYHEEQWNDGANSPTRTWSGENGGWGRRLQNGRQLLFYLIEYNWYTVNCSFNI